MKWLFCILFMGACVTGFPQNSDLFKKHDPAVNLHLSPFINRDINPDSNSFINPEANWNINPVQSTEYNPSKNEKINPLLNLSYNPQQNQVLNPLFIKNLWPDDASWDGQYIFGERNELKGYITRASQEVILCFNNQMEWDGYFVKASEKLFNHFSVTGVWTGKFLCTDNNGGYNLFSKDCKWTHQYIK
jgi:hypothetical protein